MIGTELSERLRKAGDTVVPLVRGGGAEGIRWDPVAGTIEVDKLADVDAVVHLAGANIADGRWNAKRKGQIRDSRVLGTSLIAETLAAMEKKPAVFVAASAIGFYGETGDSAVDESGPAGQGFLADVCKAWEEAAPPAAEAGIRTVNLRSGVVLSTRGGALARMIPPFKFGLGGVVGSGRQYVSWVTLGDVCRAIRHCIESESISGPVNAVAPQAATNRDLTKALGKALKRPTLFPVPAPAVSLMFGEMGRELLLASTRVKPDALLRDRFAFEHPQIDEAVVGVLNAERG